MLMEMFSFSRSHRIIIQTASMHTVLRITQFRIADNETTRNAKFDAVLLQFLDYRVMNNPTPGGGQPWISLLC